MLTRLGYFAANADPVAASIDLACAHNNDVSGLLLPLRTAGRKDVLFTVLKGGTLFVSNQRILTD